MNRIRLLQIKKGIIITVNENTRNTKYDLLRTNKEQEQKLINKVNKNNDHAMCQLADLYLSGSLGNKDVTKAFDLFIRAANRGNSHAMCKIAQLYESGNLGKKDPQKAFEWYVKAADRNNNFALAYVGQIHLSRYMQLSDEEKQLQENIKLLQTAKHYLQRGAQKGSTRAMWQLANICEKGIGGNIDLAQAIKIYRDAALRGSPTSLQTLQRLVKEEKMKAEEFQNILEQASDLIAETSSDLAIDIGLEQIHGKLGNNPEKGFMMLKASAEKNNKDALKYLGKYYRDGIGCQADLKLSQYWFNQLKILYEKSIALGNIESLLDLGDLYLKGAFGKIELEIAEELFIKAANENHVDSIYYLGTLYINGQLGNHDPAAGTLWLNKAISLWSDLAIKGNIEAANSLVDLYLDKELGFKNYQKAAYWLAFLAKNGNQQSLLELISLYSNNKIKFNYDDGSAIFSHDILNLIKNLAFEKKNTKVFIFLASIYRDGYLPSKTAEKVTNPWAKHLEDHLTKIANEIPAAALLLAQLYSEGNVLPRNLLLSAKLLALTCSDLSQPTKSQVIADDELEDMINSDQYTNDEKQQILAGIIEAANQAKKETPFRLGRILGDIYRIGKLIKSDFKESAKWYEISANLNNSIAMYHLGLLHLSGELGKVDYDNATTWLELSASNENKNAIEELAKLFNSSSLSNELKSKIKPWFEKHQQNQTNKENEKSINQNSTPNIPPHKKTGFMYEQGKNYRDGINGKPKDIIQSAFWFRKAANKGHTESSFELAELYSSGQLGEKTKPVAVNIYKDAAKQKHLGAIKAIIKIYSQGIFTSPNPKKAAKWQTKEEEIIVSSRAAP